MSKVNTSAYHRKEAMNIEDRRTENWVEDELQRRADVEEKLKIECYGCATEHYEEDLTQEVFMGSVLFYCDDCTE